MPITAPIEKLGFKWIIALVRLGLCPTILVIYLVTLPWMKGKEELFFFFHEMINSTAH